jgi:cytochrome b561
MSSSERRVAEWSELLMYGLMFAVPLVGWGMLSAARFPIVLYGPIRLPPILPVNVAVFGVLRKAHTVLAYLFFLTVIAHLTAVLFHTLVIRDRLIERMVPWGAAPTAQPAPAGAPAPSDPA